MKQKVRKSNVMLGILIAVFAVLSVSFVIEFAGPSLMSLTTSDPTIMEIRDHESAPISHFASNRTCATCHSDAINNESICKDLCHKAGGMAASKLALTSFTGVNSSGTVNLTHHKDGPGAWALGCLYSGCHEDPVQTDDARYAQAVGEPTKHEYCDNCHLNFFHDA
jgi:hypothetical protein